MFWGTAKINYVYIERDSERERERERVYSIHVYYCTVYVSCSAWRRA